MVTSCNHQMSGLSYLLSTSAACTAVSSWSSGSSATTSGGARLRLIEGPLRASISDTASYPGGILSQLLCKRVLYSHHFLLDHHVQLFTMRTKYASTVETFMGPGHGGTQKSQTSSVVCRDWDPSNGKSFVAHYFQGVGTGLRSHFRGKKFTVTRSVNPRSWLCWLLRSDMVGGRK